MVKIVLNLLLTAMFAVCSSADTMTLRSNAEINGSISYDGSTFTVAARYKDATKTLKFDRAEVRTVEINARNFNPGEPPRDISVFDKRIAGTRWASLILSINYQCSRLAF